ncbi:MAG: prepilin-type N-terminal cleavage/methylation domain-containing protein [Rickettsiales bacterium]|nr:prepilin-type N-terminal cleavage/methylation domain-containing protein [Rickettsiales bacterium]
MSNILKSKKLKAFSLIELSIVILIIGILIAGVSQSSNLFRKSQLLIAQNLTKTSPVSGIKNLAAWYETSLSSSFGITVIEDGSAIDTWYDNNPQSTLKINATQSNASLKPIFYENVFPNGIPGVRFDGTNDKMMFDGSFLIGSEYTVFAVEQKRSSATPWKFILGGGIGSSYASFAFGYDDADNKFSGGGTYGLNMNYVDNALSYTQPTARMHTAMLQKNIARSYWLNGGVTPEKTNSDATFVIPSSNLANTMTIGSYPPTTTYYNGDVAEIILFTRALTTEERQSIEAYLSKKYNITIS